MGQLEKYGLYVLCLVIFLILGVTLWGGPEAPVTKNDGAQRAGSELHSRTATGPEAKRGTAVLPAESDLDALLQPRPKSDPPAQQKRDPRAPAGGASEEGASPTPSPGTGTTPAAPPGGAGKQPSADGAPRTYTVKTGDTLESIARTQLGSPALHAEIARLNPRIEPRRMRPGQELLLPSPRAVDEQLGRKSAANAAPATARDTKGTPVAATTYTVGKGDTLEGIARRVLGSGRRVDELRELNPTLDPTRMKVGTKIQLPRK